MSRRVTVFDTTLRDGEQAPGVNLLPEEKVVLARQLEKLGVDVIEAGFPASNPGDLFAVQQISREIARSEICVLARAVKSDIDAAVRAIENASRRRLNLFISTSPIHMEHQLRKTPDQVLRLMRDMVAYAKQAEDNIQLTLMDASRSDLDFLCQMTEAAIGEGAVAITITDTVGYAVPEQFAQLFRDLRTNVALDGRAALGVHCHNDLGLAVANTLAALQAGADQVEGTVIGIGERAGNCCLEELLLSLSTRKEHYGIETGIVPGQIYAASRLTSQLMNVPLSPNKPIVGRNAFQHESGIHQDGLLKNRATYEIMNPDRLGVPHETYVLGKHSGRHAIKHWLAQYGMQPDETQLDAFCAEFKAYCNLNKHVSEDGMLSLLKNNETAANKPYDLLDIAFEMDPAGLWTVAMMIRDNATQEEQHVAISWDEPVGAIQTCLETAIPAASGGDLEVHSIRSNDAQYAEAIATIESNGRIFRTVEKDKDPLIAAAKAYLSACNKLVQS